MIRREDALEYHSRERKGKIEVNVTKPFHTQRDLSLAYTPGVAEPCLEIEKNADDAYEYTAKGNLVAVVTNGTAVLGLGNIGALASKPVMEGKAGLFKQFADVDVFDLEIATEDVEEFIRTVKLLEPTFGGINLEDIKSPECFIIEERLRKEMNIPVFHDDQHGTAIISGAALLNALEITGRKASEAKIVISGAGAAATACARHYITLGIDKKNVRMVDREGVIYKGREKGMDDHKLQFAVETDERTLADAMKGADIFCGLSVKGILTKEMVRSMADKPIIFAMANPDPEITYEDAKDAKPDAIVATGRSDFPNQVNNVLGFPFIFRGALDVRASTINEEMEIAATKALAALAKEDVPDAVAKAYNVESFKFGPDYIIPKPMDPRVLIWEATAVAKAAMDSGVARIQIDIDEYRESLENRLGMSRQVMRMMIRKARNRPMRIVYPEGENEKILRACQIIFDEGIAQPILLGKKERILKKVKELGLDFDTALIIDPRESAEREVYAKTFTKIRERRGITYKEGFRRMGDPNYYASMMVQSGDADGLISGISQQYNQAIRPSLYVLSKRKGINRISGVYLMVFKNKIKLFADTTMNIETTPEILAETAILTAELAREFDIEPRIAMLSFSNFGSSNHPDAKKVSDAVKIVKQQAPDLIIDGEMNVDAAVVPSVLKENYPFSTLQEEANVLIFPDLASGNIGYKLLMRLGGAEAVGPILVGLEKPVNVLQVGSSEVKDVVNMTAIAVVNAQRIAKAE
ncbi:NADP-dependent malic enzyme [Candidatus Marinimicrobia bacterium MT.SAG.4]|nr:NADP-dependent malic enzyme [Candidatus Marinimicrobia bacterium MT.SAG.4]